MVNTIFKFPTAGPLSCTWIRTGNPLQPLACIWIHADGRRPKASDAIPSDISFEGIRLCA